MPTATARVYRLKECLPGPPERALWDEFIAAMHSGAPVEIDEEMFFNWLEVLPPVHMGRRVTFPDGTTVHASFGFAEGAEEVTAFWREGTRFFCRRTETINPYA